MQKPPKVSSVIINYNGEKFIEKCLESLTNQDYPNFETIFIDNVSTDDSVKIVKEKFPQVKLIVNEKNTGYVGGANQAVEITDGKYLMILNPDIIYEKNYISKCVEKMEENPKIGVIGGKWLKYDFIKNEKQNVFDSTGLYCFKNRRIIDRGQGHEDKGQYDKEEIVFGISGASPMYRREALIDIGIPTPLIRGAGGVEIFDTDFFMYKEDIDVSWRLNLRGWLCYYYPQAVAYHGRGTGVLKRANHLEVLKHRQSVSLLAKKLSYKNQRLMQIKNEIFLSFILDLPWILTKEILAFGYILLKERFILKSIMELFSQIPNALKKRRWIMKNKKINWKQMHYLLGRAKE
ncbi:MAG: family 2 glycosyl transferase [Candidatus Peregrinibacteria bacterium GW2011_GWF2_33_10]|nr:MAG: family 2 glycosyl transferase [Candidatus Peregrinibacteria bacterium GW2011_GWF2_33_10]OGJ44129.1 MAG: hypothetical protein A2263_01765 [Candidatus Peregrinibacteria bacterium RIFOXYA2_FULL_33_21]OGJ47476.1 MAG: hypothetical protein A2272_06070 [Candidatus Peregrinibacteria bacterium RIFOXYA12_FULL_33_12]